MKNLKTRVLTGTALTVLAGTSAADVPAAVTTALATSLTDVGTIGGAVLLVVVAIVAFRFLRRAM